MADASGRSLDALMIIAEASGRAFLGIIGHVKGTRGDAALKRAIAATEPATQRAFEQPFLARRWYSYAAYADFLRSLDRTLGKNDGAFARELGASAGRRDLGSIFKLYVMMASAERLIRSCERIWPVYYRNAGKMTAIAWEPSRTVLRISDFKHMEPMHCRLMEGWMIATMTQIGFAVSEDGREHTCMSTGGAYHEFVCSWRETG